MGLSMPNKLNPNKIQFFKNLTLDSYALMGLDNSICVFKSINEILHLIYSDINSSIISFDLNNCKKIAEIKNAHKTNITNFRHCLDINNRRDLLLSLSFEDNNIKIWQINDWQCLLNLPKVNNIGYLKTSCFLNDTHNIYILTSNSCESNLIEPIKVFDLNGNKIKEIYGSNVDTIFLDIYYDNALSIYYIITGNNGYIRSYNYNTNSFYLIYKEKNNYYDHSSVIVYNDAKKVKMIATCGDGILEIWDFHSADLIDKIKISKGYTYSMCFWDKNYLFVGCRDKKIKLISLKDRLVKKELPGYENDVVTVKIIEHFQYGKCLISKGKYDESIKLWKI